MSVVGILPMRSGSQRVKNKNLRLLGDKPLFSFVLEQMSKSQAFDQIVVDSNSDEILNQVKMLGLPGITTSKRPDELARPETSMVEVLKLVAEKFPAEIYFQTHATSPFLSYSTIKASIDDVLNSDHDSGFGVSEIQLRLWKPNGEPINHDPKVLLPTQDLEPIFIENSSFYIFQKEHLHNFGTRYGSNPLLSVIPKAEALDIDDEEDFELATLVRQGQIWRDQN